MNPNVTTFYANGTAHRDGRGYFRVNWPVAENPEKHSTISEHKSPVLPMKTAAECSPSDQETGLLFDL